MGSFWGRRIYIEEWSDISTDDLLLICIRCIATREVITRNGVEWCSEDAYRENVTELVLNGMG